MRKLLDDFLDRYFHDEESIILIFLLTIALVALRIIFWYFHHAIRLFASSGVESVEANSG